MDTRCNGCARRSAPPAMTPRPVPPAVAKSRFCSKPRRKIDAVPIVQLLRVDQACTSCMGLHSAAEHGQTIQVLKWMRGSRVLTATVRMLQTALHGSSPTTGMNCSTRRLCSAAKVRPITAQAPNRPANHLCMSPPTCRQASDRYWASRRERGRLQQHNSRQSRHATPCLGISRASKPAWRRIALTDGRFAAQLPQQAARRARRSGRLWLASSTPTTSEDGWAAPRPFVSAPSKQAMPRSR